MPNTAPKKSPKRHWFRRKYYGWGWYPVSWEGWVIILFYAIILILNTWSMDKQALTPSQVWVSIFPSTVILTAILVIICYQTGEDPLWQWGGQPVPKKNSKPSPKKSAKKSKTKKNNG